MKQTSKKDTATSLPLSELQRLMSKVFSISEKLVTPDTTMDDIPNWTSINHVVLMAAIEKEYGFKFKPWQLAKATGVSAILSILKSE